jgi:hypothetical protein
MSRPLFQIRAWTCIVATVGWVLVAGGCGAATQTGAGQSNSDSTVIVSGGQSIPEIVTTAPDAGEPMQFPEQNFDGMTKVAVDTVPQSKALPFSAAFPKSAGNPMAVWVSNPDAYPQGEIEIIEEFDTTSPYGAFRVREEKRPAGSVDQSFIEGIPKMCGSCTDARLVQIQPGIQGALLVGAPRATSVTWLQGDYEMIVIGPAELTADTAISLSQEVAGSFDPSASGSSK